MHGTDDRHRDPAGHQHAVIGGLPAQEEEQRRRQHAEHQAAWRTPALQRRRSHSAAPISQAPMAGANRAANSVGPSARRP